jgi:Ca-dependent carbohydrate-binding module xylan-binding
MSSRYLLPTLALLTAGCSVGVHDGASSDGESSEPGLQEATNTTGLALLNCQATALGRNPLRNACGLGWVGPFGDSGGSGTDASPIAASAQLSFSGASPAFGAAQIVYSVDLPGNGDPGAIKFTAEDTQDYSIVVDSTVNLEVRDASGTVVSALFSQDISSFCDDEGAALPEAPVGTEMKNASVYSLTGGTTYTFVFLAGSADRFRLTIDEPNDFMNAYYPDADTDGQGDFRGAPVLSECAAPVSYADSAGDCDDANGRVSGPGSFDIPDDPQSQECTFDLLLPTAGARGCNGTVEVTGLVTSVNPPLVIPASSNASANLTLPPGSHTVEWTATDSEGDRVETQTVTITDLTPPVFDASQLDTQRHTVCDFAPTHLVLTVPTATDNCDTVVPTGAVTASSNPALALPLALSGGVVDLPLGTHTITWTAQDSSGNASTLPQTVVVRPAIHATNSIAVRESFSEVRQSVTVPAGIANSGTGLTDIRSDALTGDIISRGQVALGYRAHVGHVLSQTSITWDHNAAPADRPVILSETIGTAVLPPAFNLSTITFPTTPGQVYVNNGNGAPLNPGSYGSYSVNSGGTLRLNPGVFFFEALTVNSGGKIVTTAGTILYVKNSQRIQGPIVNASNQPVPVVLGFNGTTLNLESNFYGTVVAPNATVNMGNGTAQLYRGVVHAKTINQQNGADFECVALACASSICESGGGGSDTCSNGLQDGSETGVDCGGTCPACQPTCNPGVYEAETMFHSTGNAATGGWNIYSNGYISTSHTFSAGASTVTVTAKGTVANNVWPHMIVSVGGVAIGNVYVTNPNWATYSFPRNAAAGSATIQVSFDNDFSAPPQDRNLYVDKVAISCP